jgi:hypothetical protein
MEGPHQLHRRLIVSQPGAELADGQRLAAQARLQAQFLTGKADILLRGVSDITSRPCHFSHGDSRRLSIVNQL